MVKRYWRPPPKYYDEDKLRAIREIAERLPALVEARDEHSYVMLIDKATIDDLVRLFHDAPEILVAHLFRPPESAFGEIIHQQLHR